MLVYTPLSDYTYCESWMDLVFQLSSQDKELQDKTDIVKDEHSFFHITLNFD